MKKLMLVISVIFSFIFCLEVNAEVSVERLFPYTNGSIDFYFNDIEISDEHTYKWAIEKLESTEPTTYFDVLSPDYTNKQIKISILSTDENHLNVLKSSNIAYITIKDDLDNVILDSYKVDLTLNPFAGFTVEKNVWYDTALTNPAYDVKASYGITSENIQFLFEKIEDKDVINNYVDNNKDLSNLNLKSISEKPSDTDTRWKAINAERSTILFQDVPTEDGIYYLWLKGNGTDIKTIYGYNVIEVGTVTKIEDTPITDNNENETPTSPESENKDEEIPSEEEKPEELLGEDINTELKVVKPSSEKKDLDNDQGYIQKTVIDSNPKNGEVTIQLELKNFAQSKDTVINATENAEIVIVMDESGSMNTIIDNDNDLSRLDVVFASAKELVNNILGASSTVQIGTVSFGSRAEVTQTLTNDKNLLEAVYSNGRTLTGLTATTEGLTLAETLFTNSNNTKIIILLTDGNPTDSTTEDKLKELENKGYHIITMLTDNSYSSSVFGTMENPTAGKLYLIGDSEIETVIKNDIFSDVTEIIKTNNPIYNITITDYFPEDILKYFEFSYITKPTNGTLSEGIDGNKTITYTLDELKGNQSVIIAYKLKLKNMKYKNLLDKVISTNEKVVLDYEDSEGNSHNVILDSSPTVKLSIVDDSHLDEPLNNNPKTGLETYGILIAIGLISIGAVSIYIKKKNYIKNV